MAEEENKLSTSALARKLEIPAQLLFSTLKDFGWIERHENDWTLNNKGIFEGGSYQNSRRYGRYIVWPASLEMHPLIKAIEAKQRITAAGMSRYYTRLHPRHINRALAEIGLQQHSILGWELTAFGRSLGGQQEESENTGAYYVTWPHEIVDHPVVHRELSRQASQIMLTREQNTSGDNEEDLFAQQEPILCQGVDGHSLNSTLHLAVCNWLYLAQLVHAYQRALPTQEAGIADFYLPAGSVYIDCWAGDATALELSAKLANRSLYRQYDIRHIEINEEDADRLDEVLGRGLHAFGIRC